MAFFLVKIHQWRSQSFPTHPPIKTWPAVQCSFNSASDPFNGQTTNSISKAPKVIESRTLKIQSGDLLKQHWSVQLVKSAPIPLGLRKRDGLFRSLIENNFITAYDSGCNDVTGLQPTLMYRLCWDSVDHQPKVVKE